MRRRSARTIAAPYGATAGRSKVKAVHAGDAVGLAGRSCTEGGVAPRALRRHEADKAVAQSPTMPDTRIAPPSTQAIEMPPPRLCGLAPVVGEGARLLVLGSFPGVASLREQQYYAHPRNQFWPILSAIWGLHGPEALQNLPYADRLPVARARGLAIWDVYAGCLREGSLDSAITDAELNDLPGLVKRVPTLRAIAHNGGESARHMKITGMLGLPVFKLPSTSPANASWPFERKLAAWRLAFEHAGIAA